MNETERLTHYDVDYYLNPKWVENQFYAKHVLRPQDMGAAYCYAYGATSYDEVCEILGIPEGMKYGRPHEEPVYIPDEYDFESVRRRRWPSPVLDVGAGRGELCVAFGSDGGRAIGVDPSPGAAVLFPKTQHEWAKSISYEFINTGYAEALQRLEKQGVYPRTVILCETLEHIPEEEFAVAWEKTVWTLRMTSGMFIVTNWIRYHPIGVDDTGYDHVRQVDDELYDVLSRDAREVVYREGSHLVLQF